MNNNDILINHLINTNALHSANIIDAFKHIDRADFVYDTTFQDIYGDYPLQIGFGQTISQPTTVAMMMEMLQPKAGQKILDIGSGSGWTTALLSYIVKENGFVVGLERVKQLVEFGNSNIKKYNFKNSKIIQAQNSLGIPNETFDRILVSAAANELPQELIKQLKTDGKLVIPVRDTIYEITKKQNNTFETIEHYGFVFVPLIY